MSKRTPIAWRRSFKPQRLPTGKPLSGRETTVVIMIADGYTNKQMADILGLSVKTIECHRAHAMQKTGAYCLAHLVRYAMRAGLVT